MMTTTKTLLDRARALQNDIVQMRRHFHRYPELSFQETESSKTCAERLKESGYSLKTGVAKTGIVGTIGSGGKTIAIRADMDGLPIIETNPEKYSSANPGVMHACGHDAHMASGLAAAKILSELDSLPGTVRMILQPAEENGDEAGMSGAFRMIEEGVMEGVDAVIGLHMDATLPAGKVAIMPGPVMASADSFKITICGRGGHGAYPETTVDAVVIAAQVVTAIQQIVSRRISALEPSVVTVGSISSSSLAGNVISETVTLLGTIRAFNETIRRKLIAEVERACTIARALGGDYKVEYEMGYPATINDAKTAEVMKQAAIDLIGAENVITLPPKTWAEDFSMLAEVAPGAFMFLGGEIAGSRRNHHSPTFDIDESGLFIGPAILAETALRLMRS